MYGSNTGQSTVRHLKQSRIFWRRNKIPQISFTIIFFFVTMWINFVHNKTSPALICGVFFIWLKITLLFCITRKDPMALFELVRQHQRGSLIVEVLNTNVHIKRMCIQIYFPNIFRQKTTRRPPHNYLVAVNKKCGSRQIK